MPRTRLRTINAKGLALGVGLVIALPTLAAGAVVPTGASRKPAAATSGVLPRAAGRLTRVIVLLRDDATGLAARSRARTTAVLHEELPIAAMLASAGAALVTQGKSIPYVVADVTAAQRAALGSLPSVRLVVPDAAIPFPTPELGADPSSLAPPVSMAADRVPASPHIAPSICGTAVSPEVDPEAINVINAPAAAALGYDGAGVTVAYIADGVSTADPDFQRNAAYASAGSPAGSPVLTQVDFTGDPSGTPTSGGEAFLDSSSIGAQGSTVYNLHTFINASHTLPSSPCDIKITGAAPGASVLGLDVFSTIHDTTESNFIQAIDYAVGNDVKVLNESFGSNNFPDTALDATRIADDDAVAAGVTVVVSSGDSGITSTTGSPATDPDLISVGASTTFRSYEQATYGGINATTPDASNGTWLDNNISGLSSGGFAQGNGSTVDLVAPGDLNWALCDANSTLFTDCTNDQSPVAGSAIELSGGTSESSPLTAAAAADVIQAYASTHAGVDPTPALIKQILMSTAIDVSAPADQQGAGLLDVLAAVKEAASITGTSGTPDGGLLISPSQINVTQNPGASSSRTIDVTNTGSTTADVQLSTRALTDHVATQSGSFCLNPSAVTSACGPPTASTIPIWSGATEVYQEETFSVPSTTGTSRLNFSADYPFTGQSSLLHVALIDPTGAYAGYSLPQGLADFANIQVADPTAGTWTAVFFTLQDGSSGTGTSGTIQWAASESEFAAAGKISSTSLSIPAGQTSTATFTAGATSVSGDASQSIVLSTSGGPVNTIPVTVRTRVDLGKTGGTFTGILTGGNGRGNPAQTNTYAFVVPAGLRDLDVSALFADTNDGVAAFLLDPEGQAVASSSSVTLDKTGATIITTGDVNVYKYAPQAGTWTLVLDWLSPVSGSELSEPFQGDVRFNRVEVATDLPAAHLVTLNRMQSYTFRVTVKNAGTSPEAFFLDPRTTRMSTIQLKDQNGSDQDMTLPLAPGLTFPLYEVPSDSGAVVAHLTGTAPVTFDTGMFTGDPDLSPLAAPGVTEDQSGDAASVALSTLGEVTPGLWYLNPSELGPYTTSGAPSVTTSASFDAVTRAFDMTVTPSTGDLWSEANGITHGFTPVYVLAGHSATMTVKIKPTAPVGSAVTAVVYVDDVYMANELIGLEDTGGDELAALPFRYKVGR
jgi:hypothetical protein